MVAANTGWTPETIKKYVRQMEKRGDIYIVRWERAVTGCPLPVYAVGPGKSVRRPPASNGARRSRKYRARLERERLDEFMRQAAKARARHTKVRRDIAASWI